MIEDTVLSESALHLVFDVPATRQVLWLHPLQKLCSPQSDEAFKWLEIAILTFFSDRLDDFGPVWVSLHTV